VNEPLGIALVGCGTVGGGVARLLLEQPERLAARAGRPLALRRVVVRDPDKPRAVRLPHDPVTADRPAAASASGGAGPGAPPASGAGTSHPAAPAAPDTTHR
jgi:homoserine dehydrogenase